MYTLRDERNDSMKKSELLRLVLIGVLATQTENAQSRAYVKFGPAGQTIGLFNLLKKSGACYEWRTYDGSVRETRLSVRNRMMTYRFALRTNSAMVNLEFTLDRDEIPTGDIENLLTRMHRVAVRACAGRKRTWMVEEITKIESIRH
jgi:hypothetical protein